MNRSLIGRLIGPKGDNIRELERSTGAKVSIHEEGDVEDVVVVIAGVVELVLVVSCPGR